MVKGYVTNNTGRSRHIFKRTVYPGQRVALDTVYNLVGKQVPEDQLFVDWLDGYLPSGWEIEIVPAKKEVAVESPHKETLLATPVVEPSPTFPAVEEALVKEVAVVKSPSMEYATPRAISKMTARDIFNLKVKENPKRILKNVNSIYKLRRALTLCKNDSRKATLSRLIQGRIRELNVTL